jgi:cell division protein FtsL
VRALPEHRVVDRLLRSRLWIWALGALLGGIVTMQVSLLKLNSGISRAVETTTTLERQNAELEMSIARLSSPQRIDEGAQALGMILPPAGEVDYLTAGPQDAERAVRRMQPPSEAAAALLANGGIEPGALAAPAVTTTPSATTAPPVDPATDPAPAPTEQAAPVVTSAPPAQETTPPAQQTTPPTTTQTSPAGGAVAGQG